MLTLSFTAAAQTVTLKANDMPLKKLFTAIEKQTGYTFFYKTRLLKDATRVSVNFRSTPLGEALEQLFANQPITYSITGKMITLEAKQPLAISSPPVVNGNEVVLFPTIGGTIYEESTNRMLEGVTVSVAGSGKTTMTDARGNFSLKNVKSNDVLILTSIGYTKQTVPVNGQPLFYVSMKPAVTVLDQAIVQAYGTTTRRLATGNIGKVSGTEIAKQPVLNPLLALQGRVPGLVVTQTTGFASSPVNVRIRGINNLKKMTNPLYVIDKIPVNEDGNPLSNAYTTNGMSPLFFLNPNDIESIEVLKDADATAIYGSRGANGVILITTKKGKAGPTQFTASISQGITRVTRYWDMLDNEQYLQVRREALANDGISPSAANAPDLVLWDPKRNINWQKELWGRAGKVTSITAGFSGGDQQNTFRLSAGYNRNTDITAISGSTQRATLALALNHKSLNQKLSFTFSANYGYSFVDVISGTGNARLAPNAPPIFDKYGAPNWAEWNADGLLDIYPFSNLFTRNPQKSNSLSASASIGYVLMKGLTINVGVGHNLNIDNNSNIQPKSSQNPFKAITRVASFNTARGTGFSVDPGISYNTIFGKHNLGVLFGGTLNTSSASSSIQTGVGYSDDYLMNSINNATTTNSQDSYTQYKYAGLYARLSYNYDGKYVVNLNARRDGSSRFAPGRQYGNFGAIGVAWIASEEPWLKKLLPEAMSFVKFRGSYGLTGSDGVGDYQYLSLWTSVISYNRLPLYDDEQVYAPYNPPNQVYQWQTDKKLEAAIELGFLQDSRLVLSVSHYRNRASNQIIDYPLGYYTGFSKVITNMPANIENSGWEFGVNGRLISTQKLNWSASFNIGINKNKLLSYPGLDKSPYANLYIIGKPLSADFKLHYTGISPLTGEYTFEDYDGDGLSYAGSAKGGGDTYVAVDRAPKFSGGFGTTVSYGTLSVSLFFNYTKQLGENLYSRLAMQSAELNNNQPKEIFNNRWQKPGDIARYPALTTRFKQSNANFSQSDGIFTDGSYLRLNNVNISWSLPQRWLSRVKLKNCALTFSTQNLFVITRYKGMDPELQNFGGMPPTKVINTGLSFTF
jgi:TonB-linked SusC/RagA family outer membrane protein